MSNMSLSKRVRDTYSGNNDLFQKLPDDIVISIISKLSAIADCPRDLISILILCKRLNKLGLHPLVLSKASLPSLAIKAKNWSKNVHNFLNKCVTAGNVEASYILGMIEFYCLQTRRRGFILIRNATLMSHALATYSLGIIISANGSGKLEAERYLQCGVSLYQRAASLGHNDALRELGHCLHYGYGVQQDIPEGRRILLQANARELGWALRNYRPISFKPLTWQHQSEPQEGEILLDADPFKVFGDGLWSDYGCVVPQREMHPVHRFMVDWFNLIEDGSRNGLQMCCYSRCGRSETRKNEFTYKCECCEIACYCSNGCLVLDWKMRHKMECPSYNEEEDSEYYYSDEDSDGDNDDDDEDNNGYSDDGDGDVDRKDEDNESDGDD